MPFDFSRVSDITVCPASHSPLVQDGDQLVSVSPECRRSYDIIDDIPRLLVSESKELSLEEWGAVMLRAGRNPETGEASGASAQESA